MELTGLRPAADGKKRGDSPDELVNPTEWGTNMDRAAVGEFIDAAVQNQSLASKMLAEDPALLNATWIHGESVLHFLVVEGYVDGVRFLLKNGADVRQTNESGDQPIIDAATLGRSEMIRILLDHGADPNAPSEVHDNPLHCAVGSGCCDAVSMLLDAGADPSYVTDIGHRIGDDLPDDQAARKEMREFLEQRGLLGDAAQQNDGRYADGG